MIKELISKRTKEELGKVLDKLRKHPESADLPRYVSYIRHKGNRHGYSVYHQDLGVLVREGDYKGKNRVKYRRVVTVLDTESHLLALPQALEYLEELNTAYEKINYMNNVQRLDDSWVFLLADYTSADERS